jgi:hypothetical protein
MRVGEGRSAARQWVIDEASRRPGFHGAYFAGSTSGLADDAPLPATSDLDVNLVFGGDTAPSKRGKLVYRGVLLDVTSLSLAELGSPEHVLGHYHLAGGFRVPTIIVDPSGQLTALQAAVSRDFARRVWVRRRCAHARSRVLQQLDALEPADPFHDQVIRWLFPTGIMTHVLLVAGLQNPTVRRRYAAARDLLAVYGHLDFYERLLDVLGCAWMDRARVEHHLAALTEVFDAATGIIKTPFPFASDISDIARPIAIDGSQHLIERGLHREAVFWIAVTYARCQTVFAADAPTTMRQFEGGFRALLGDLGIASFDDLRQRREHARALLPPLWDLAEAIMAANPEVMDEPSAAMMT